MKLWHFIQALILIDFYSVQSYSEVQTSSANQLAVSNNNHDIEQNTNEVLTEMATLKERNKSMEKELNEMQERYLEISLKFAEVESERQQLVMALRKNGNH